MLAHVTERAPPKPPKPIQAGPSDFGSVGRGFFGHQLLTQVAIRWAFFFSQLDIRLPHVAALCSPFSPPLPSPLRRASSTRSARRSAYSLVLTSSQWPPRSPQMLMARRMATPAISKPSRRVSRVCSRAALSWTLSMLSRWVQFWFYGLVQCGTSRLSACASASSRLRITSFLGR